MLICAAVCKEMKTVLNNDDNVDRSPGERLEEAVILTAALFQNINNETLQDRTADRIKTKLQGIVDNIKREFSIGMSLKNKLQRIDEVFFQREGTRFSGNTQNYYDYKNSLLDVSLRRRKAIPMTLALLYKFICRRLDILVEVVGLPGHIVVHVPELDRFVDVFAGGRILTAADCANIVSQFGFPMQQSYLSPLPPEQVVHRILNNLENCLVRNPNIQRPASSRQRAAITALRAVASNPGDEQLEQCRHLLVLTWTSEACVGTDISDW
jgi:regulator of sirC expression with transglutaminase-like and TPR domain